MKPSGVAKKLGIKPGMRILVLGGPPDFVRLLGKLPQGAKLVKPSAREVECAIAFVRSKGEVQAMASTVFSAVLEDGLVWFAYPKRSSAVKSDLSRDSGWEPVFAGGYDSVAQISISETWTGFRFRPKQFVGKRPG